MHYYKQEERKIVLRLKGESSEADPGFSMTLSSKQGTTFICL